MQFTGRENDGTGLYYYRARYFSPTLQRFISEDPIKFAGGLNLYSYVENNPIMDSDPFGLKGGLKNLGLGWSCYLEKIPVEPGFELHVYDRTGTQVGIVRGRDGWIGKHGFASGTPPPGIPRDVLNKLNGLNVQEMRRRGQLPPKGTRNIRGGRLSGRLLGILNIPGAVLGEIAETKELERRARKNNLTPYQQFCRDSWAAGNPEVYLSPLGFLPNPAHNDFFCGHGGGFL